jgi:hypothetical protein
MRSIGAYLLTMAVLIAPVGAQETGVLHLGPLTLQFPAGWKMQGNAVRVVGRGPNGEGMIANYAGVKGAAGDPSAAVLTTARGFADDKMPGLAQKNGKVIRAVAEHALPDGTTEFSALSQGKKLFRDYFFLQYLFSSKRGMAYFTVEGYGDAASAAESFERILATQQWSD